MADDLNPWATIIITLLLILIQERDSILIIIIPICLTEEYATNILKSFWRIQFNLIIATPMILMEYSKNSLLINFIFSTKKDLIKPNLPNFKRIPAKIIDPETGASTWAFGNQMCNKKIGIFTIKINLIGTHIILFTLEPVKKFNKSNMLELLFLKKIKI